MNVENPYEVQTWQGLVQQVVYLVSRGYFWYCVTRFPRNKKDKWYHIDHKLIRRYRTDLNKFQRARRKSKGLMNFFYLRWGSVAIILHTAGSLDPNVQMDDKFHDARKTPVFLDISSLIKLRVYQTGERWTVNLARETFQGHKAELEEVARMKDVSLMKQTFDPLNGYPAWAGIVNQKHALARYLCHQARAHQVNLYPNQLRLWNKRTPVKVWCVRNPE